MDLGETAAHGPMLVVMGGRMLDTGWFRSRAGAFLNDVVVMGREADDQRVAWQQPHLSSPAPVPREFHTLTQLPFNRFLLFGGVQLDLWTVFPGCPDPHFNPDLHLMHAEIHLLITGQLHSVPVYSSDVRHGIIDA